MIRTYEGLRQQIYSLPPLATWVSHQRKRTNNYAAVYCCCQDNSLPFCKKVTQKGLPSLPILDYRSKGKTVAQEEGSCQVSFKKSIRSEEHTSELQSRGHLVCRLL